MIGRSIQNLARQIERKVEVCHLMGHRRPQMQRVRVVRQYAQNVVQAFLRLLEPAVSDQRLRKRQLEKHGTERRIGERAVGRLRPLQVALLGRDVAIQKINFGIVRTCDGYGLGQPLFRFREISLSQFEPGHADIGGGVTGILVERHLEAELRPAHLRQAAIGVAARGVERGTHFVGKVFIHPHQIKDFFETPQAKPGLGKRRDPFRHRRAEIAGALQLFRGVG